MSIKTRMVKMLPKQTIINMVHKKLNKGAGFEVTKAKIFIDYPKGLFNLKLFGEKKGTERTGILKEYSDISEMLLEKVNAKLKSKVINLIDLEFDFVEKKETCEVFYVTLEDFRESFVINDLF